MAVQQVTGVDVEIEPDSTIAQQLSSYVPSPRAISNEPIEMDHDAPLHVEEEETDTSTRVPVTTQHLDLDLVTSEPITGTHTYPINRLIPLVKPVPNFTTMFKATHKESCICATFSLDGKYAATGSTDSSIKVLDAHKIKHMKEGDKPVLKTLYGHAAPINDLAFHPNGKVLASASSDCTVKLFDVTRTANKRAAHSLQESYPIRSISFHPSGDYFALGLDDVALRLYDTHTLRCYSNLQSEQDGHKLMINKVHISPTTGSLIASASADGDIRVWDMVSGACIKVIPGAHEGWSVSSVRISLNEKYLLTCGKDNAGRLWEWSTGRLVHKFDGAVTRNVPVQMSFSYNEDHVFGCDEITQSITCWDTRTGRLVKKFKGHEKVVRMVATSPVEDAFISCSDDNRARFWFPSTLV